MTNLKVIIVDDEMLIRKLIRMKLTALNLNIDIVGEFENASKAMDVLDTLQPDIILSDICMPGEDGIDFSKACLQKYPQTKIIIITGFNDFDYARRSLKAGVFDYIMKPVQSEELNETITKAIQAINNERQKNREQELLLEEFEQSIPVMCDRFINRLLTGEEAPTREDLVIKLNKFGIKINDRRNAGLSLGVLTMRESVDDPKLPIAIEGLVKEFFQSEDFIYVLRDPWGRIVIISNTADFPMEQCLTILTDMIHNTYHCHVMSAASDVFNGWEDVRKSYLNGLEILLRYHSEMVPKTEHLTVSSSSELWTALLNHIKNNDAESVRMKAEEVVDQLLKMDSGIQGGFLMGITSLFNQLGFDYNKLKWVNHIENYSTKREYSWWINERLTVLLAYMEDPDSQSGLLRQVLDYLYEHVEKEDLNQNNLSEHFGISSSHLSRLMKQYIGKTYGEILSDLRLSRMLEMLNHTDLKDRDIGEKIGIYDAHYLSIWFKKMTGYSVSEYRKLKKTGMQE